MKRAFTILGILAAIIFTSAESCENNQVPGHVTVTYQDDDGNYWIQYYTGRGSKTKDVPATKQQAANCSPTDHFPKEMIYPACKNRKG